MFICKNALQMKVQKLALMEENKDINVNLAGRLK
jgi:hypothetical protein